MFSQYRSSLFPIKKVKIVYKKDYICLLFKHKYSNIGHSAQNLN